MKILEPSDDWRTKGLDEALEPQAPLTDEEKRRQYEYEREMREDAFGELPTRY
jgi:hypothetical protein